MLPGDQRWGSLLGEKMGGGGLKNLWENRDIYVGMFPKTSGTPKSFILKGFSIVKHPFWGPTPIFGNIHVYDIYSIHICVWSHINFVRVTWFHPLFEVWKGGVSHFLMNEGPLQWRAISSFLGCPEHLLWALMGGRFSQQLPRKTHKPSYTPPKLNRELAPESHGGVLGRIRSGFPIGWKATFQGRAARTEMQLSSGERLAFRVSKQFVIPSKSGLAEIGMGTDFLRELSGSDQNFQLPFYPPWN